MVWRADAPQCNEVGKMLWELVPYTRGRGLDVGCGPNKGFPHFIGVDSRKDTQLFNIQMQPDVVADAEDLTMFADDSMDFVFSSHTLEHIQDYKKALKHWWGKVRVGGHLCLYLPHKNFYPNIGQPGSNPDHKHDFLPQDIVDAMLEIGHWDLLRNEDRNENEEYSFFQVYRKCEPNGGPKYSYQDPKPSKTCAVVRYGAWGDALQASSIFPELKAQGYHITLYTTPRAWEVIQETPDVDRVILQDTDQVPNQALTFFWANEQRKYDKWINLSESVEAVWLVLNDRSIASWPTRVRDKYLGKTNYVEFAHELADVPYKKPNIKFLTNLQEKKWVEEQLAAFNGKPLIVWALNGSSVHKVWPHIDQIFSRILLTYPEAIIVTVGDQKSRQIDEPWQNEPRIRRTSGLWSIRQALAIAQRAHMVIGPETGVLSSVCMEKMPKIVFLSHSSHDNLTRDWTNVYALFPTKTACYPCHKMHYTWDTCNRNNDNEYWGGTAQCQVDIPPEACWTAVQRGLRGLVDSRQIKMRTEKELNEYAAAHSAKPAERLILPAA